MKAEGGVAIVLRDNIRKSVEVKCMSDHFMWIGLKGGMLDTLIIQVLMPASERV